MPLAVLVLAAMPAITAAAGGEARTRTLPPAGGCRRLTVDVADGREIPPEAIEPDDCVAAKPGAVRFDRATGASLADGDLAAGSYLGRISAVAPAAVARGAILSLVSTAGPVRIVRQVTALQPSRGGRVFVRDGDGQVFAVTLLKEAE